MLLIGRRAEPLEATAERLKSSPGEVSTFACDIRDVDAGAEVLRHVRSVMRTMPTALVNNAGGQFPVSALDISRRGWNAVVDVNLTGTFQLSQALARAWIDDGIQGGIVNMTIPWHGRGASGLSPAVAARSGVVGLTKSLALEWAPHGIRVNCIAPGLVLTEGMVSEEFEGDREQAEKLVGSVPLMSSTSPEEVALVLAFLLSESTPYMTGAVVPYDGGAQWGPGVNFLNLDSEGL